SDLIHVECPLLSSPVLCVMLYLYWCKHVNKRVLNLSLSLSLSPSLFLSLLLSLSPSLSLSLSPSLSLSLSPSLSLSLPPSLTFLSNEYWAMSLFHPLSVALLSQTHTHTCPQTHSFTFLRTHTHTHTHTLPKTNIYGLFKDSGATPLGITSNTS